MVTATHMAVIACLFAADFALLHASASTADRSSIELGLLSYNIRKLPDTRFATRKPLIQEMIDEYDIVLLQEDFRPGPLHDDWSGWRARGPGPRFRLSHLLTPAIRLFGRNAPYGSGLSILTRPPAPPGPLFEANVIARVSYDSCHGVFGASFDCWANKGLVGIRVTAAGGGSLDVYTTHLEAGGAAADQAVRARQLATLTNTIETRSENRAVLLSGDFNAPPKRRADHRNLMHAVTALGLTDTGARPTNRASDPCRVIRTFYRSGTDTQLTVLHTGEVIGSTPGGDSEGMDFCSRGRKERGLSDHPALEVQLRVELHPSGH